MPHFRVAERINCPLFFPQPLYYRDAYGSHYSPDCRYTFVLWGTVIIGIIIRNTNSKSVAESLSRISHALFWFGLVMPEVVGIVHPGLGAFDGIIGFPSFQGFLPITLVGWIMLVIGVYFTVMSNYSLKNMGSGYAAFKLTKNVVDNNVYRLVRNPMSLGYYLLCYGLSLVFGSSYLLLGSITVTCVHVFNLLYFEKNELELRYGDSYKLYAERVPFILPVLLIFHPQKPSP